MKKWALAVFFGFILSLAVQTSGGASLLYEFAGTGSEGLRPWDSLIMNGSTLYGMTENGGNHYCGIIFKIESNGTGFSVLHSFALDPQRLHSLRHDPARRSQRPGRHLQNRNRRQRILSPALVHGGNRRWQLSKGLLDPQRLHSLRHGLWGRGQ
ncbi:MAG: hypothetical protein JRJ12_00640 [Deltaproteobacteria bacterium]|nr:hypothetical protein [Deltaproteobacteria bacterium]